ncbi:hypothetical protein C804_05108 [Lachnospiraceae bacterium A4]|nr:hypothetical protein C804_05108 [Lachnospiraceae bacterium A4]
MIYSVNFVDMTLKLNPLAVTKYLSETNWELYPIKRNDIKIFQYKKEDLFEQVTIPLDKKLRDYKNAMYDAVCKIAYVEKKSVEQLMLYLLNPNTDILKIRLDKKEVESGNIMFDDAIQLFDNAKKLIAATALDVINPKKIHYGRINEPVRNFLSQCRFGQTEIGSYVVSVICPFVDFPKTEGYKKLNAFFDEEQYAYSLTREVINRLMTNVATIKQKIDDGNLESLANYDSPISSNFYEALSGLSMDTEDTTVEFMAEWSPTVKSNQCKYNRILITNDYYEPIRTIISKITEYTNERIETVDKIKRLEVAPISDSREYGTIERTEIVGKIIELKAAPVIDSREYGTIVIYVGDNARVKSVTVKLDREDYDKAVAAHQHGKAVKVVGDLKGQVKSVMENVIFSVVE